MKIYRYIYDNKMLDDKDLVIIWDEYGIGDPPAFILDKRHINRIETVSKGKVVFGFKESNLDGMVKLGKWFDDNNISYILREEDEDSTIIWEDNTQVMFIISDDDWRSEERVRNNF